MTILVTGGAGCIGSNFVVEWFKDAAVAGEPAATKRVPCAEHTSTQPPAHGAAAAVRARESVGSSAAATRARIASHAPGARIRWRRLDMGAHSSEGVRGSVSRV